MAYYGLEAESQIPAYTKVLGAYLDAEEKEGEGGACKNKEFLDFIQGPLWDLDLQGHNGEQEQVLLHWLQCRGLMKEFKTPPQNFIKSI
jgi:hypothetical protein